MLSLKLFWDRIRRFSSLMSSFKKKGAMYSFFIVMQDGLTPAFFILSGTTSIWPAGTLISIEFPPPSSKVTSVTPSVIITLVISLVSDVTAVLCVVTALTGITETTPIVPRIPITMVDVLMSKDSSSLSFSCTSKRSWPLVSLSSSLPDPLVNSARLFSSSVMTFESSRPIEARLPSPVTIASPLSIRTFFISAGVVPSGLSISTVPS